MVKIVVPTFGSLDLKLTVFFIDFVNCFGEFPIFFCNDITSTMCIKRKCYLVVNVCPIWMMVLFFSITQAPDYQFDNQTVAYHAPGGNILTTFRPAATASALSCRTALRSARPTRPVFGAGWVRRITTCCHAISTRCVVAGKRSSSWNRRTSRSANCYLTWRASSRTTWRCWAC